MAHPQFQPASIVASMLLDQNKSAAKANEMDEIGVLSIANSSGVSWSFIFPLEGFGKPKYKNHVQKVITNELFGRVVHRQMLEPVAKLSAVPTAERTNLKLTLESIPFV